MDLLQLETWPQVAGIAVILGYQIMSSRQTRDIHRQIRNDHTEQPNLRHQLDSLESKINDIHKGLGDERESRAEADKRLDDKLDEMRDQSDDMK